jgi:hypothetical protein
VSECDVNPSRPHRYNRCFRAADAIAIARI